MHRNDRPTILLNKKYYSLQKSLLLNTLFFLLLTLLFFPKLFLIKFWQCLLWNALAGWCWLMWLHGTSVFWGKNKSIIKLFISPITLVLRAFFSLSFFLSFFLFSLEAVCRLDSYLSGSVTCFSDAHDFEGSNCMNDVNYHLAVFPPCPVMAMLSHGLKQWLSTWWEGRANPGELRCMQCTWVTRRGEARIHLFLDLS